MNKISQMKTQIIGISLIFQIRNSCPLSEIISQWSGKEGAYNLRKVEPKDPVVCVISDKKRLAGYLYRTATTAYPCYLPVLGEFSRSWPYKTCRCKYRTSGVAEK